MKPIEIDTAILNSDISTLRNCLEQVRMQKGLLIQTMGAVDNMWEGPANNEFAKQYEIDERRITQLCDLIDRSIDCVEFARTNYDSCEEEVAGIIGSIRT